MPNRVQKQQAALRAEEIAEIGPEDSKRLHDGMNKSGNSSEKRSHMNPDVSGDESDTAADNAVTSTSGSKRHASAGAGPSEPTVNTAKEKQRATSMDEDEAEAEDLLSDAPTRRNDLDTKEQPMRMHKGSDKKFKETQVTPVFAKNASNKKP